MGYKVQTTIAQQGLNKDYVQVAVSILREPVTDKNRDLRGWALAVMDKTAPVPLSPELREGLASGSATFHSALAPLVTATCSGLPQQRTKTFGETTAALMDVIVRYQTCRIAAYGAVLSTTDVYGHRRQSTCHI